MRDDGHVIDIERIVLSGVDLRRAGSLRAAIETEVRRAIGAAGVPDAIAGPRGEAGVAGAVARSIIDAVHGGREA